MAVNAQGDNHLPSQGKAEVGFLRPSHKQPEMIKSESCERSVSEMATHTEYPAS